MSVKDLRKALEGMTPNWGSIKHVQDLFSVFLKDYDKQVHVPHKQLEDRFEAIKGQKGRAFECFFIKELLEASNSLDRQTSNV